MLNKYVLVYVNYKGLNIILLVCIYGIYFVLIGYISGKGKELDIWYFK